MKNKTLTFRKKTADREKKMQEIISLSVYRREGIQYRQIDRQTDRQTDRQRPTL